MNFLRDRKLARRLKNNEVSSKEQFIYYLLFLLTAYVAMTDLLHVGYSSNIYSYIFDALTVAFPLLIASLAFIANNKGDKKDFIVRSICIAFPIYMQLVIIEIPLVFLAFVFDNLDLFLKQTEWMSSPETPTVQKGKFIVATLVITYIYNMWRMYTAMLIASGAKE